MLSLVRKANCLAELVFLLKKLKNNTKLPCELGVSFCIPTNSLQEFLLLLICVRVCYQCSRFRLLY